MELKIGNTRIVDCIEDVDFNNVMLGDQFLIMKAYNTDIFVESKTKQIQDYMLYFTESMKYNNSLIKLKLNYISNSIYNDNEDNLTSIANINKTNTITILNINNKKYIINNNIILNSEINIDIKYEHDSFIKNVKENIEMFNYRKYINLDYSIFSNNNENIIYHYLIVKMTNDLYLVFCICYKLELDSCFFKKEKICFITDKEKFSFIPINDFDNLLDFLQKNNLESSFFDEETCFESFKHKLNIFNYSLFDIIYDKHKRFNFLNLLKNNINEVKFEKKLCPLYESNKLKLHVLYDKYLLNCDYVIVIDGKQESLYSIKNKEEMRICEEIISYFNDHFKIINIFNGEIINDQYKIKYKDCTGAIVKFKNSIYENTYYKIINGYYIKTKFIDKNFIKELKERYKMNKKLEA